MAGQPLTTTRRALLGAAAALPVAALADPPTANVVASEGGGTDSETWSRRLMRYRRLAARMDSEAELASLRAAYLCHAREVEAIKARFGDGDEGEALALCEVADERREAADDSYYDRCVAPSDRAAVLLALTPPPDLKALRIKINVMDRHRLDELASMERPVLEVLAEDVERLGALGAGEI